MTPCSEAASSKCWLLGLREPLALQRMSMETVFCVLLCSLCFVCLFTSFFVCKSVHVHLHICAYTRRRMCGRERENIS